MIIIPERKTDGLLNLDAYSLQIVDFNFVSAYLNTNEFDYSTTKLERDKFDRRGIRFSIANFLEIIRLESLLGVNFQKHLGGTRTRFKKSGGQKTYRCVRIRNQAWEGGCKEVSAPDDHTAYIKCTILAGEKNWLGVISEEGHCT